MPHRAFIWFDVCGLYRIVSPLLIGSRGEGQSILPNEAAKLFAPLTPLSACYKVGPKSPPQRMIDRDDGDERAVGAGPKWLPREINVFISCCDQRSLIFRLMT